MTVMARQVRLNQMLGDQRRLGILAAAGLQDRTRDAPQAVGTKTHCIGHALLLRDVECGIPKAPATLDGSRGGGSRRPCGSSGRTMN
jgi:hypothetical protein